MTQISGSTALVTGGASGIGLLMGEMLLQKGLAKLIVWDVSAANIETARARLGDKASFAQVDVTDTAVVLEAVAALDHSVDILVNNAGIIVGKPFADHTHAEIDRTMAVNSAALMHLARALLPAMIAQGRGHIVNIASAAGMVANPNMSVYCASKWAVIGWSDSLRLEMEAARTGVKVTTVTPYYIDTGMFHGVTSPIIPILKPEPTAAKIIRAIERNRILLRMPGLVYTLPLVRGLLPTRLFDLVVGRFMGIYASMKGFKGRGA
ncbi:SDR family oxidoreductase [Sinirhodobacter sp. WL0062]|uniref:SDR family oxidoreductase n=1 Tax=Rhodobacter flavimaris TaxID=2907145 RepID=A0ABS8Z2H3_9RHOB|nr:SDR family oxidoreductase [Sinirhodobacter sp. WL0062]MCE5974135.1 SDR family oxidoreductase [Sinirhodobacter sp. WL0062]